MVSKICSRCLKPFESEQYKTCEACRDASRKYRESHLEHYSNLHKECQYYKRYAEKHAEYMQQWRPKNRKRLNEYSRNYYKVNREQILEQHKLNSERGARIAHTYRARKKGSGGTYNEDDLKILFDTQEGCCYYCGKLLYESFDNPVHVEHKIPISRGGKNNISNIALSCARCNSSKGNKTHKEFLLINGDSMRLVKNMDNEELKEFCEESIHLLNARGLLVWNSLGVDEKYGGQIVLIDTEEELWKPTLERLRESKEKEGE